MKQLEKYLVNIDLSKEVIQWINTTLKNYLLENEEDQGEIEHIIDYLQAYKGKSILGMQYKTAKLNAAKWVKALSKRGMGIIETEEDYETFMTFNSGYRIVKLKTDRSYKKEGSLMSHCVSSYFGKANYTIYSLRDEKNMPHATIGVSTSSSGAIDQIKGKGNGSIHPNYIKYILKFFEKMNLKIKINEMKYLGYIKFPNTFTKSFIEQNFTGIKTLTIGNEELFYTNSNLKRIE